MNRSCGLAIMSRRPPVLMTCSRATLRAGARMGSLEAGSVFQAAWRSASLVSSALLRIAPTPAKPGANRWCRWGEKTGCRGKSGQDADFLQATGGADNTGQQSGGRTITRQGQRVRTTGASLGGTSVWEGIAGFVGRRGRYGGGGGGGGGGSKPDVAIAALGENGNAEFGPRYLAKDLFAITTISIGR